MVGYYYNHQISNKGNATKAFSDFVDCYERAAPEFREQIRMEITSVLIAKSNQNPELNNALNRVIEYRSFISQF